MSLDVLSSDEDEEPTPIMLDHSLYFLSGVFLQENFTLQMGCGDTVPMDDIQSFYRVYSWQDLNVTFWVKTQHADLEGRAKLNRIQNRQKVPVNVQLVTGRDELLADDTPFADQGIVSQISHREAGPDISLSHRDNMDQDQDHHQETIDDVLKQIWRQFPYDLFENAPNHQSNQEGSHLLLSEQGQQEATIEVFQNTDLTQFFSRVVVKIVQPDKWHDLEFKRYFPAKGFVSPTYLQNFRRMRYFQEWNTLMDNLSLDDATSIQESFWVTFQTFHWLPLTESDQVWNTRSVKPTKGWVHLPYHDNKPVVRIGLNGTWVRDARSVQLAVIQTSDRDENSDVEID